MFGAWVEHAWDVEMFHITMVENMLVRPAAINSRRQAT